MKLWLKYLTTVSLIIILGEDFGYIGSEEKLRQYLKDSFQGKLKFTDENMPFYKNELEDSTPANQSEYDFIVIGAGSAGVTMASRLSEIDNITVLLIEAGFKEYPIMDIPNIYFLLQLTNDTNWDYRSESSDTYCLGMANSQCRFPRGKVMGGTSVLNALIATRGNRKDYDDWAKMTGDDSWSYKEMLRYFKKLESFEAKELDSDDEFHNKNGPLPINTLPSHTITAEYFIESGKELGYSSIDYNGKNEIGFSYIQSTTRNGERWSTNRAYLHPLKERKNLFLTRNSHVSKVLINATTKLAYGVEFTKAGNIVQVMARKEIILCSGAINSPKILMLSGVGPASHLRELNITVIQDAPVGENFMDHTAYAGLIFTTNQPLEKNVPNFLDPASREIKDYINFRTGTLAIPKIESIAFINVDDPSALNKNPNMELLLGTTSGIKVPTLAKSVGIDKEYFNKMDEVPFENTSFTIWPMVARPKSRGKIILRSKDPNDKPKIYANFLDDPEDVRITIKGIRFIIEKLMKTKTYQKHGVKLHDIPLPKCQQYEYNTDAFWECASRTYTVILHHQSGTCKMGREDDPTAVLNSKLQVIGIKGLRVVDASIMPQIISAHINIPIIAISEKLADVIKKDWNFM